MSNNSPVGFSANMATLLSRTAPSVSQGPYRVGWLLLQPHCPLLSLLTAFQPQPLLAMTHTHEIATPSLPVLQRFCACYTTTWSALVWPIPFPYSGLYFRNFPKLIISLVLLTSYNAVFIFLIARTLLDIIL